MRERQVIRIGALKASIGGIRMLSGSHRMEYRVSIFEDVSANVLEELFRMFNAEPGLFAGRGSADAFRSRS